MMLPKDVTSPITRRRMLRITGLGGGLLLPAILRPLSALAATPAPPPAATATPTAAATATATASPTALSTTTPTATATSAAATATATATATSGPTVAPSPTVAPTTAFTPFWVQALQPVSLWDGPDSSANLVEYAQRWDYLQVVQPQTGSRLYVLIARDGNNAWVDALSVGPSGPPPAGWPPDGGQAPSSLSVGWVATASDSMLYADAAGTLALGIAPAGTPFTQLEPQSGSMLHVQDPYSSAPAYVLAQNMGTIDPPTLIGVPGRWWGTVVVSGANVRSQPTTQASVVAQLPSNVPIVVSQFVAGEAITADTNTWGQIDDGKFVYYTSFRPTALPGVPNPPAAGLNQTGPWIDVNLTLQVVMAYNGTNMVRAARTSTGEPSWETTPGVYSILRRVANETMDSNSLIGLDAQRATYHVDNVLWTQYFSNDGKALHDNYWKARDEFGIPSSHGCAGLVEEDAKFLWDFADIGTPIYVHN